MEDKIELVVSGITVNEVKYGAYALILSEVDGERSIPVVVGPAEAQSIAAKLNGSVYPRPLSHDVFASAFKAFGIEVKSVYIYKFEKGIFYSEIKSFFSVWPNIVGFSICLNMPKPAIADLSWFSNVSFKIFNSFKGFIRAEIFKPFNNPFDNFEHSFLLLLNKNPSIGI